MTFSIAFRGIGPKGRVKRTRPCANRIRPKRQGGQRPSPCWQPDSLNFCWLSLAFLPTGNLFAEYKTMLVTVCNNKITSEWLEDAIKIANSRISPLFLTIFWPLLRRQSSPYMKKPKIQEAYKLRPIAEPSLTL